MQHLKKFNESQETPGQSLRDLIGDVKETKKQDYRTLVETTKGCFLNFELQEMDFDWLDSEVSLYKHGNTAEITLRHPKARWNRNLNAYLEGDVPKIISTFPGDERGCFVFGDVFISSGHDGNYLWNIKTGEFKANTW
jgi:hypothetical protein